MHDFGKGHSGPEIKKGFALTKDRHPLQMTTLAQIGLPVPVQPSGINDGSVGHP